MSFSKPYPAVTPPLLLLGLGAAALPFGPVADHLRGALFDVYQAHLAGGAVRPALALPGELGALLLGGGIAIALMTKLRSHWAGLFVALTNW